MEPNSIRVESVDNKIGFFFYVLDDKETKVL